MQSYGEWDRLESMSNKKRTEETWPVRVSKSAMEALKKIQEREKPKTGVSPSYMEILSRLAIKEANK